MTYTAHALEASNFIGGKHVPADSGETKEVASPSGPSEVLGTTPKSGKAETKCALEAADSAFANWANELPSVRGEILMKAAQIIESREDELARLMARESGKPIKEGRAEVARAATIFRYYGAKIQAMVENNNVTWDVVDVANDYGLQSTADFLEPLDYSVINREPILEGYADEYRVASMLYADVISYNMKQINGTPESWVDFFDLEKFSGKRTLWKNPSETLEAALLGDSVSAESLYPLDVDRALNELDTIKSQIVWGETGAQSQQLIANGEVVMASILNSRIPPIVEEGAPVKIQWNQSIITAAYLVVPKGALNKEQAMELVAYIVSGRNNHRLSNYIAEAPTNKKAIPKVDEEVAGELPTAHRDQGVSLKEAWWDENGNASLGSFENSPNDRASVSVLHQEALPIGAASYASKSPHLVYLWTKVNTSGCGKGVRKVGCPLNRRNSRRTLTNTSCLLC